MVVSPTNMAATVSGRIHPQGVTRTLAGVPARESLVSASAEFEFCPPMRRLFDVIPGHSRLPTMAEGSRFLELKTLRKRVNTKRPTLHAATRLNDLPTAPSNRHERTPAVGDGIIDQTEGLPLTARHSLHKGSGRRTDPPSGGRQIVGPWRA